MGICCCCCLINLKPRCIEIITLIINLIEIGFMIWGIIGTQWKIIKIGGKIIYLIPFVFVVFTLLFLLILMYFRCGNKINTSKNSIATYLCIIMEVFDFLSIILIFIDVIIISKSLSDAISNYEEVELDITYACLLITYIPLVIHLVCVAFLLILILVKTNLSYLEYMNTKEQENIVRTVNALNSPQNNEENHINILGVDQNGHPFYYGNAQYFTQNQIDLNKIKN